MILDLTDPLLPTKLRYYADEITTPSGKWKARANTRLRALRQWFLAAALRVERHQQALARS